MTSERCTGETTDNRAGLLLQNSLIAVAVAGLCFYGYFLLAPWIWRQNIPFQPADITPWILECTSEHDGVEIYALYILMFVNIAAGAVTAGVMERIAGARLYRCVIFLCVVCSAGYLYRVGFVPPMNSLQGGLTPGAVVRAVPLALAVFLWVALLWFIRRRAFPWVTTAVAAIALAPVCFIATSPISWDDYTYTFAPALRLITGASLRDIYFQYDLLPSLLAAVWMKLGLDLNSFQLMGRAAYYTAILGVFLLSERLFRCRELPLFLVTALILGRIYASPWDAAAIFQVTPWRLDLWLPLLLLVYRFGPCHWSVGLACGLLILLLKNFGIIYSLAYLQLLITLFIFGPDAGEREMAFGQRLVAHARRCRLPVMLIIAGAIANYALFHNEAFGNYAGYYQKIGIGFIQIATDSFYWYLPPVLGVTFMLLYRLRRELSPSCLATGIFLLYCAIGNSIYFFGRSHEHNLLNISIVLLFLFFFMLDLAARFLDGAETRVAPPPKLGRRIALTGAVAVTAMLAVWYSGAITGKLGTQIANARQGQAIYPRNMDRQALQGYLNAIRYVTNNSRKVYFVSRFDFDCYFYGGYTPVGYCNPFKTWIFTNDLKRFLQGLLDSGYYLVCAPEMMHLLNDLKYDYTTQLAGSVVVAESGHQSSQ
jgi:hypothetical protein